MIRFVSANDVRIKNKWKFFSLALLATILLPSLLAAANLNQIRHEIGINDALLVTDSEGTIILSKNATKPLVPASILKIFTSLVAMHYLGHDYRFTTEFYLDPANNLKIKGYGDPLLVSEIVTRIAQSLASRLEIVKPLQDIILDDSQFVQPLTIPGISASSEPYDAPNGALCVNFNTVYFKRTNKGYISAEPQTPLLPIAMKKIILSKAKQGRIVLSGSEKENTLYAGQLFRYFLEKNNISIHGSVKSGLVNKDTDRLILRYFSPFTLTEIISKLLEHSNNFTTNQLLISAGINDSGPPGNLTKGVLAARKYARDIVGISNMKIVEGSGISRENRVTAAQMRLVLDAFEPYHTLLRREGRQYYKTGTLHGISTRAGYIQSKSGELYQFVVMLNTPGKSTRTIMRELLEVIE